MATPAEILEGSIQTQTRMRLFVWNDTTTQYDDFSNRFEQDRLIKSAKIAHVATGKYGQPVTKAVTLSARNTDRYWDGDAPTDYSPWEGRHFQLRLEVAGAASDAVLATFRLAPDGIVTDDGPNAILKLEPLTEALRRADADDIKNGAQKYQGRSWLYLSEELIRSEYGDASGDTPSGYEIPTDARFNFPDGEKHLSDVGRPPQWDGSSWNDDNTDTPLAIAEDFDNDRIFVGVGPDLWVYDTLTDTWENLGEDSGSGGAGETIRGIYWGENEIVVVKWEYDPSGSSTGTTLYVDIYDFDTTSWDSTARTTVAHFFPGVWWQYDGIVDSLGRIRGCFSSISWPNNNVNGLASPIPFPQYVKTGSATGANYDHRSDHTTDTSGTPGGADSGELPESLVERYTGYFHYSSTNALKVRIAAGNRHNVQFKRTGAGGICGYLYFVRDTSAGAGTSFQITQILIVPGFASYATDVLSSPESLPVHSLALDQDASHLAFISWWERSDTTGYDITNVKTVNLAGLPNSSNVIFGNAGSLGFDYQDFITDILFWSSGAARFVIVKRIQDSLNDYPEWQVVSYLDDGTPLHDIIDSGMTYFIGPQRKTFSNWPMMYVDANTGALKFMTSWTASELVDGGLAAVPESTYCADFDVEDVAGFPSSDPRVVGLAMPYHLPETQETTPDGKYHLWWLDSKHSGRVPLADFDGMTKLEALSELVGAHEHAVYADGDGDFVIEPRVPSAAPTETIEEALFGWGWASIKKLKSADIVNYISTVPYESALLEMEADVRLTARSKFNGVVLTAQLDTFRRRVKMRCIRSGRVDAAKGANPWFDFRTFYDDVTTRLATGYVSGTSVTVENVSDIEVGDTIRVYDSGERDVTAISGNVLTIESGWSGGYDILSQVIVSKANQDAWSSHEITTLNGAVSATDTAIDVHNASNIAVGNFIIFNDSAPEKLEVLEIDGDTLTTPAAANAHDDDARVGVLIIPNALDESFEIGGQAITVTFQAQSSNDSLENVYEGDLIEFYCPGMELRQARGGSKVQVSNADSIKKHGKRQPRSSGRASRFLTFRLMEFKNDAIVNRHATVKRRYSVSCPLSVGRRLYDTFYLKSEKFFPDEAQNRLAVVIQEVHYDVDRHGVTFIVEEQ